MTKPQAFLAAAGLCIVFVIFLVLRNGSSMLCSDLDYVSAQSESSFDAISLASATQPLDEEPTSFMLDGASSCFLVIDPERASYQCNWEFDEEENAEVAYNDFSDEVEACLSPTPRREDASVNHPDFWASTYFELPGREISVAQKNKLLLGKTFVSIQVDGLH